VTSIGGKAFYGCFYLNSIVIPQSVTLIGERAFMNCETLSSIKYCGTAVQWDEIEKQENWDTGTKRYTVTTSYKR
jgi:hypothetical protein